MTVDARLESRPFDPSAELRELTRSAAGDGAIASFIGLARSVAKSGEPLQALILDHHPRLTLKSLQCIAADAAARFDVTQVRVVHRCGGIESGEPIVFVGAASAHRRAAFDAADYLMDRLKTEAVFWKREETGSGATWIEPTDADYADRARWE